MIKFLCYAHNQQENESLRQIQLTKEARINALNLRKNRMTEDEYNAYLNSPDYLCKYYQKSIWKESERAYGKKQYQYTEEKLSKIKALKDEGKALCDSGKLKEGEAKLVEAIKIISHTRMN